MTEVFDENYISEVQFQVWQQTDRSMLKTEVANGDDFIQELCDRMVNLKSHDYYAKQQSAFMKQAKNELSEGEFIVQCDFAENYAFVVQNAAQAFHWNNDQTTIFTVVIYYKEKDEIKHKSIAILSDNLKHDTTAVYQYQTLIIE